MNNPHIKQNNIQTPLKKYYNVNINPTTMTNLNDKFNEAVSSHLKKITYDQEIPLETSIHEHNENLSKNIINELNNRLNYFIQVLHFKESNKETFIKEIKKLKLFMEGFVYNVVNFDENNFTKLKNDFNKIKLTYDANLLSHADSVEWELFYNSTTNFFEYLHNSLDKVNLNFNIQMFEKNVLSNVDRLINIDDYKLNERNNYFNQKYFSLFGKDTLISHSNNDKVNGIKYSNEDKCLSEITIMKKGNDFSESVYNSKITSDIISTKHNKKRIKHYFKLKLYVYCEENISTIKGNIINIIKYFKHYLITFKENNLHINNETSSHFLKIIIIGITYRPSILIKRIRNILKLKTQFNTVIKITEHSNIATCLKRTLFKLKTKYKYIYYSTNFSQSLLNSLL